MGKVLLFLRVSTESQELENQKKELENYVKNLGYNKEDCVLLEKSGASAIKLDDDYMLMVNQLIEYIDSGEISCVALWSVDRVLRDEEIWPKIKKKLVANKIQLIIKNPSLALLNPDGSINEGSELALSLFSTMASQEMRIKQERFKRTKRAYAKQGKWSGGKTIKFGYKVDENQFFVEDENDGAMVKLIFELYSTGQFSTTSISDELNARGWKRTDGLLIYPTFISNILKSKSYTGAPDEKNNNRIYPPLITEELFQKCREVADSNKLETRQGKRLVLGAKLLRCKDCGALFTSNSRHFSCCRYGGKYKKCLNNLKIRQCVVNNILWRVAYTYHIQYLLELNEGLIAEYTEKVNVLDQKIVTLTEKIDKVKDKKKRVIDTYLEGLINKKERDLRLSKIDGEVLTHKDELNALNEQKNNTLRLLENVSADLEEIDITGALDAMDIAEKSDKEKYDIIHKHIDKVIPERMSFGKRDPRTKKDNGILFTIYMVNGNTLKYLFIPKFYQGHNLYIWNGKEWVADMVEITDNVYVRKEKKEAK